MFIVVQKHYCTWSSFSNSRAISFIFATLSCVDLNMIFFKCIGKLKRVWEEARKYILYSSASELNISLIFRFGYRHCAVFANVESRADFRTRGKRKRKMGRSRIQFLSSISDAAAATSRLSLSRRFHFAELRRRQEEVFNHGRSVR